MMKAVRLRPSPQARVLRRADLYSRHELESLHVRLLASADVTTDQETSLQLETLIAICSLLLDDGATLTAVQRIECQRELLLDAAALGVNVVH